MAKQLCFDIPCCYNKGFQKFADEHVRSAVASVEWPEEAKVSVRGPTEGSTGRAITRGGWGEVNLEESTWRVNATVDPLHGQAWLGRIMVRRGRGCGSLLASPSNPAGACVRAERVQKAVEGKYQQGKQG
jgi:hypothetical protein